MVTQVIHGDITMRQYIDIAKLKAKAWPNYTLYEHMKWIVENTKDNHVHNMLYENNELHAYCCTMDVQTEIDGKATTMIGLGNLCSGNSRGAGALLMKQLIGKTNIPLLSFCNYEMVSYYKNFGWQFIHRSKLDMPNIDTQNIRVMVYNLGEFETLKYLGGKF